MVMNDCAPPLPPDAAVKEHRLARSMAVVAWRNGEVMFGQGPNVSRRIAVPPVSSQQR
jgi:hypothetical protein